MSEGPGRRNRGRGAVAPIDDSVGGQSAQCEGERRVSTARSRWVPNHRHRCRRVDAAILDPPAARPKIINRALRFWVIGQVCSQGRRSEHRSIANLVRPTNQRVGVVTCRHSRCAECLIRLAHCREMPIS